MNRRTFFRVVTAGLAVVGFTPQTRETRYRPYRIGDTTIAVDDTQWDSQRGHRVSLWDGDYFVKVVSPLYLGRAIIVPVLSRRGKLTETSFELVGEDASGLAEFSARYEYGPKWWKHSRPEQDRRQARAGVINRG